MNSIGVYMFIFITQTTRWGQSTLPQFKLGALSRFAEFWAFVLKTLNLHVPALNYGETRKYMRRKRLALPRCNRFRYRIVSVFGERNTDSFLCLGAIFTCFAAIALLSTLLGNIANAVFHAGTLGSAIAFILVWAVAIWLWREAKTSSQSLTVYGPAQWLRRSPADSRVWGEMPERVKAFVDHLRGQGFSDGQIGVHELEQDSKVFDPIVSTPGPLGLYRRYHAIYVGDEVKAIVEY